MKKDKTTWWRNQNLTLPITDPTGRKWNFCIWYDFLDGVYVQRIFFWDEEQRETGIIEFRGDQTLDHKKIKYRVNKIARDPLYRQKYLCDLEFPVERYY